MNHKEEKRKLLGSIRINLLQKTDIELLDFILSLNKSELNSQIPNNDFPVWDIAYKLKTNNWTVSSKQRTGLINTVSYYYSDYVYSKALSNIRRR